MCKIEQTVLLPTKLAMTPETRGTGTEPDPDGTRGAGLRNLIQTRFADGTRDSGARRPDRIPERASRV
jgi:hypothetical protein